MKKTYLQNVKRFLLLAMPALASSLLAASPSEAATFARSQGESVYLNFNHTPFLTETEAKTDTLTLSKEGSVLAFADAQATFIVEPPFASSSSLSEALGDTVNYLGLAESTTTVRGFFNVKANTTFSFDFAADLYLETEIESPPGENARASGDVLFTLVDTTQKRVLDFFSIMGNLNSFGKSDFIAVDYSENVAYMDLETHYRAKLQGKKKTASAFITGFLERYITQDSVLAVVEIKRNQARVTAPEPSSILALLASGVVIIFVLKGRCKEKPLESSIELKTSTEA
ncbi:PEP-CTERM sorting domain-containing protein [Scytonema sp. UIC 10036]|uniref:PEP-CTERM sorting domain-containing protein n=1 Tax=Scytonema sp. UIC 10036 TaxID=2304196 RepID=UPI0012DAB3BD|nr:PEP-CTERM sorting domain-containing protein [Scytonema sp. UIC 10036]MUG99600.1 PEP-CTERM sorting domain-containing protein [Scytonema sp. UIC 10036]